MSQNSEHAAVHPSEVPGAGLPPLPSPPRLSPAIDPAARQSKRMYDGLSASSAGLELGIAVGLGAVFGAWLDGKLGTAPWMMLIFLILGTIAGFRGVLRAVARAERAALRG
jgi:F0F1-type ATP synthase assembly protein I